MFLLTPRTIVARHKMSKNYILGEFYSSLTAYQRNIYEQFVEDPTVNINLKELCDHLLEPLCDLVGHKIPIKRGYLCPRLAKIPEMWGGSYRYGYGVDLDIKSGFDYDKIIEHIDDYEHDLVIIYPRVIYVSYKGWANQPRIKMLSEYL